MKTCLKDDETQRAVDMVKTTFSPATPCVNAGADGYCTGPCQGAICCGCADYKPQTAVAVADGTATLPALVLEHPVCTTTAEAVRFDLNMAKRCGAMSLAYIARAGWRLACEKESVGHGAWLNVCKELGISADTAGRYIKFYYGTVGERLRAQGAAHRLVENLTDAMIEEATAGLESKTATGAMIELGIVKRPAGWGGEREGAGRKAALPTISQAQAAEQIWTDVMNVLGRATVLDAVPLLGEKAAAVCLDRVAELERALRRQVAELKGGR